MNDFNEEETNSFSIKIATDTTAAINALEKLAEKLLEVEAIANRLKGLSIMEADEADYVLGMAKDGSLRWIPVTKCGLLPW